MRWLPLVPLAIGCGPPSEEVQAILDLEGNALEGKAYYDDICASCHNIDGSGSIGPDIRFYGIRDVVEVILEPPKTMEDPIEEARMDDQEIADLAAYVEKTL